MGQKLRNRKGDISIENNAGRIRLRWRYAEVRYSLSLNHAYSSENLHYAKIKEAEIQLDILKGCFDPTLKKYKNEKSGRSKMNSPALDSPLTTSICPTSSSCIVKDLIPSFDEWATSIRNVELENTSYYFYARKLLEQWENYKPSNIPAELANQNYSASTYNDRLSCLNNFFTWLVKRNKVLSNPLEDVRRKKKKRNSQTKRGPIVEEKISEFLEAIKNDTYCPKSSAFKHSYYYPFLCFIFYTGVRNAEAIGLRVKHVNLSKMTVEISETFARTMKGSHHSARRQKGTKTEKSRILPLNDELSRVLM